MKIPYIISNNIAYANIKGSVKYPDIKGKVKFVEQSNGILVKAEIFNLPITEHTNEIYGFHIHEGNECTGNEQDEFKNAGSHFTKVDLPHPYHSGDMPPLFGNNGYAYMSFFTNKFTLNDIIGKVVIVHSHPDDFHTNPSGNSGEKIACGKIYLNQMNIKK